MGWYSRALVKAPYAFIIVDVLLAFAAAPLAIYFHGFPKFSDPLKGFDPRGTEIRGWMQAAFFTNELMHDGKLQLAPPMGTTPSIKFNTTGVKPLTLDGTELLGFGTADIVTDLNQPAEMPRIGVSGVVEGTNLMNTQVLRSICDLKQKAIKDNCEQDCEVVCIADVIADLQGTTCDAINSRDVVRVTSLLQECAKYYFAGHLKRDCNSTNICSGVPLNCQEHGAVYKLLHDYSDRKFLEDGNRNKLQLSHSMMYIQWFKDGPALQRFFTAYIGENLVYNERVKMHGLDLTINRVMFEWYILQDLIWYMLAMGIVVLLLVIYLRSFILMLTVILNVVFSLSLGYFFYFVVFRFNFFPFINILAGLLLIALGADDLFIFYDLWRDEKARRPRASYEELVSLILYKGGTSVFVTSFTTATALLANFVNDVTAIRCFGAFAAICVIANFFLFITWVPAVIVVIDYAYSSCSGDDFCPDKSTRCCRCLCTTHDVIWKKMMPKIVIKAAPFWIILILLMAAGSLVATFYKPKLQLPSSNNFQPLVEEHPFEVYKREIKDKMRFESKDEIALHCQFLWGVEGADTGNVLDPNNVGQFTADKTFNIYEADAQIWLAKVCEDLRKERFLDHEFASKSKCFWQVYKDYIQTPCNRFDQRRCCGQTFPANQAMSRICMVEMAHAMHTRPPVNNNGTILIGLPLFNNDSELVTFQMFYKTSYIWTGNYDKMDTIYSKIKTFITQHSKNAPDSSAHGYVTGAGATEFRFYDLQKSLASGTVTGIGVSIAVGSIVLLLTTQNVMLTFYAMLTIVLVLSTTTGTLAVMGWELNTSEALILTLSMGLSIDFTIHHGIAYKMAPQTTREGKVRDALSTVGSAITMAGLTTFGAGASMISASVWAYRQFGIFLVLTMLYSWFYANFFFLSICSTIGPIGNFGDFSFAFRWLKRITKCNTKSKHDSMSSINGQSEGRHKRRLPEPDEAIYVNTLDIRQQDGHDNQAYTAPPEIPARIPISNTYSHSNTSDSPRDFNYKHIKKHIRRKTEDQPTTSSSSSTSSFPNFYSKNHEGEQNRFNPPLRTNYRKDYLRDRHKDTEYRPDRY